MSKTPIPELSVVAQWMADPARATMILSLSSDMEATVTSVKT